MIDEQCEEGPCAVCAASIDDCVCPECPTCGEQGRPRCYAPKIQDLKMRQGELIGLSGHGLKLSREQAVSRQKVRAARAMEHLKIEQDELARLEAGGEFSDDLADSPDPWS
jgi:hypothetical protein